VWSRLKHHFGNVLHGRGWNDPGPPSLPVKAATDVTTIVSVIISSTPLGYASAAASVANDPSKLNLWTNGIGLVPFEAAPMAITGAFNDILDYKVYVYDGVNPSPWKGGLILGPSPTGDAGPPPAPEGGGGSNMTQEEECIMNGCSH
jgi:hypothetical protein